MPNILIIRLLAIANRKLIWLHEEAIPNFLIVYRLRIVGDLSATTSSRDFQQSQQRTGHPRQFTALFRNGNSTAPHVGKSRAESGTAASVQERVTRNAEDSGSKDGG